MLMFYYSGNLFNYDEALNSYTNLDITMYNLYFVLHAVEMPRYFRP